MKPPASPPGAPAPSELPFLPDLLERRAAEAPQRPWLFHPDGLDWRWISWGEAAARVGRLAAGLREGFDAGGSGLPPRREPVPFAAPVEPASVLLALALEAAGWEPAPWAVAAPSPGIGNRIRSDLGVDDAFDRFRRSGGPAWTAGGSAEAVLKAARRLATATEARRGDRGRRAVRHPIAVAGFIAPEVAAPPVASPEVDALEVAPPGAASAGVTDGTGGAERPTLPPPPRQEPGDSAPPRPPSPSPSPPSSPLGRGGAVAAQPWAVGERVLLAWSLLTGGVLVLEPLPSARVATAAWARPTLFLGTEVELARLAEEAEEFARGDLAGRFGRGVRRLLAGAGAGREAPAILPFRRLQTVVVAGLSPGETPGTAAESSEIRGGAALDAFRRRGTEVLSLSRLLAPAAGPLP